MIQIPLRLTLLPWLVLRAARHPACFLPLFVPHAPGGPGDDEDKDADNGPDGGVDFHGLIASSHAPAQAVYPCDNFTLPDLRRSVYQF